MGIIKDLKKLLGIPEETTYFDRDLIIHANTVFSVLHQLGIGPEDGFFITDQDTKWEDFLGNDPRLNDVKTYVYLRVRMLFDLPASSTVIDAMKNQISELEWRIAVTVPDSRKEESK